MWIIRVVKASSLGILLFLITCGLLYAQNAKLKVPADFTASTITLNPQSAAPTPAYEGEIYYNNAANQINYYNTSWHVFGTDHNVATQIVAALNSDLSGKTADWICTGTNDQTVIQSAINALGANGGVVYLLEGTYNISASINLDNTAPNDSGKAIIGTGAGTVLKVVTGVSNVNVINASIVNSVLISRLMIDGNAKTGSNNRGIVFANTTTYSKIDKVWVKNMSGQGIMIWTNSESNIISNSNVQGNGDDGIDVWSVCKDNIISNNNTQGNGGSGISLSSATNNTISNNNTQGNSWAGLSLVGGSNNNTIFGNNIQGSTGYKGIYLTNASNNSISGNIVWSNYGTGIDLYGANGPTNNNTISGNNIQSNGQWGVIITDTASTNIVCGNVMKNNNLDEIRITSNGDSNIISSNVIYEPPNSSDYPINIATADSDNNYLVGNLILGSTKGINDLGTNTRYTDKVKITLERAAVWTVNSNSTIWTTTSPTSYLPVVGNGSVTAGGTPLIAPGKAMGDMFILEGINDTNWVKIPNGGNVKVVDVNGRTLGLNDVLTLIWDGTNWVELSWANNSP